MEQVIFLTTSGCHLCESAQDLLHDLQRQFPFTLTGVDIASDDALIDQYGLRIPVIRYQGTELDWPFDAHRLKAFLQITELNLESD